MGIESKNGEIIFSCTAEDMHPYNCDRMWNVGECKHCDRKVTESHNPIVCGLCNYE